MSELLASRPEVPAFGAGPAEAPAEVIDTTAEPVTEAPTKPVKGEVTSPGGAERGPDGKFLPRDGARAEPKAAKPAKAQAAPEATPEAADDPADEEAETEGKDRPTEATELSKDDFLALAKKHGFELDRAGRVTTAERHKFREEKRQETAQLERRAQEVEQRAKGYQAQLQQYMAEIDAKQTRSSAFEKAIEAGDFDAVAVAAGRKDWQSLQQEMLDRVSDPTYKQLIEMQRWKEQKEAEETERQKQWERQQQEHRERLEQQEIHKAQLNYKTELSAQMAKSNNPVVAAMYDDPVFIETIFQYQRQYLDAASGTVPSPEVLIRRDEGGIRGGLEKLYSRLGKALGAPSTPPARSEPEASPEATRTAALGSAPAPKAPPKQPSSKGSVGPSVAGKIDPNSEEWFKKWNDRFRQSLEAERKGRA